MGDDKVLQAVEPEAVAVDSGKKKHRKLKIACLVALAFLLVGCPLTRYVLYPNYRLNQIREERAFDKQFTFANDFEMIYVGNPEIEGRQVGINVSMLTSNDRSKYSKVEFVMVLPPPEQREHGVIHFAPNPSGKTQDRLDYYNLLLIYGGEYGYDPAFPRTMDFLINERQTIMSGTLFMRVSDQGNLSESEWQRQREILYAKIFLLQAEGEVTVYETTESIDKDGYARHLRDYDEYPLVFAAPPADGEAAAQTFYLYPHEDGHTDTLLASLNGIIAEQPELLKYTDLEAPLTLDNILNDRDELWMVIHRLDSAQMARFRTH
jgi:hypothetical protein